MASNEDDKSINGSIVKFNVEVDDDDGQQSVAGGTDETDFPRRRADVSVTPVVPSTSSGSDPETLAPSSRCLFIEMLKLDNGLEEWAEAARWLKFEEDVEEGGRWSKPHVATVPLHSLLELRGMLEDCIVLFDVENTDGFEGVIDMLLHEFVTHDMLEPNMVQECRQLLLYRHTHQHERHLLKSNKRGEGELLKPIPFVQSFVDLGGRAFRSATKASGLSTASIRQPDEFQLGSMGKAASATPISETKHKSSIFAGLKGNESHEFHKTNYHFKKKLPSGTEATNVLIGTVEFLKRPLCAFVRFANAEVKGDLTEVELPSKFLFVLLGPDTDPDNYHEVGRSISTLMSDDVFRDISYIATDRKQLIDGIGEFLQHGMVLPPGEWDPGTRIDPPEHIPEKEERTKKLPVTMASEPIHEMIPDLLVERTGRCCGGLISDIKRIAQFYRSQFTDACNFQCLASIIFMYFACLSPVITFGGLLSSKTHNTMGAIESLLSAAICGVAYHLCAGQPLTILGSTGPVLVFEETIFRFCSSHSLDYLGMRVWIGIWMVVILLVIIATDACSLIKHITRFTEESFAALIGIIFIFEACQKMAGIYYSYGRTNRYCTTCMATDKIFFNISKVKCDLLNGSIGHLGCSPADAQNPSVFWFSFVLFLFTFFSIYQLKQFKSASYFPSRVRAVISNFSVVVVMAIGIGVDSFLKIPTPKLIVPRRFRTTIPGRGWFVSPFGRIPWYYSIGALLPAVLVTILIFMDQNITTVIINRKENKLKKGGGYHLDMVVIAVCILINSFIGIPWFVAATVLSVNHVLSLKIESECSMPGEKPKFIGIIEQRVTGLVVNILIGLSVFLTGFLKHIPMPVLYGVFLYMGVSSLPETQFFNRILLMGMPIKYQPDYVYLRHVSTKRVHMFTIIQTSCMVLLLAIKSNNKINITFPIMVLALVMVRKILPYCFTRRELTYLDDAKPEANRREEEDANEVCSDGKCTTDTKSTTDAGKDELRKLMSI